MNHTILLSLVCPKMRFTEINIIQHVKCAFSHCVNFWTKTFTFLFFGGRLSNPPLSPLLPSSCAYVCIYMCIYIYIYDSQIVHHNPCFNLFILHNNSGGFCCTWTSNSYLQCSTHHRNSILVQFFGWLFHALQTLANQWLSK